MKYAVIIQPDAERDVDEAYVWLAEQSPDAAARWLEDLGTLVDSLETFPKRCGLAPESEFFDIKIRQLPHGAYRILFTVKAREVHILHVRHGSRRVLTPEDK